MVMNKALFLDQEETEERMRFRFVYFRVKLHWYLLDSVMGQ
jgi:hypothetical protein